MKTTGIIRKLDELGRIVIPKEIRRRYKIEEGDYIDISTNQDTIVLKKYDPLEETFDPLSSVLQALKDEFGCDFLVTNKDSVVLSTLGEIRKNDEISESFLRFMRSKDEAEVSSQSPIKVTNYFESRNNLYVRKIEKNEVLVGYVVVTKDGLISKVDRDNCNVIKRCILLNYADDYR